MGGLVKEWLYATQEGKKNWFPTAGGGGGGGLEIQWEGLWREDLIKGSRPLAPRLL